MVKENGAKRKVQIRIKDNFYCAKRRAIERGRYIQIRVYLAVSCRSREKYRKIH